MDTLTFVKSSLATALLLSGSITAFAGNGGGLKPTTVNPAGTPSAAPATATAPAAPVDDSARAAQVRQIETFIRSTLPAILAAEFGDDSSLAFLKDKVTYFDTLQKQCLAAKANHTETTAIIKKLDPADISIDSLKNEARANVMGNLVSGNASTPMLWVVNVKIFAAATPQPFAISQIVAAKLPGN